LVVAGLALLAGLLVLGAGALRSGDDQTPSLDPTTSVAPAVPASVTPTTTVVVTSTTGAPVTTATVPSDNQGAGSDQRGPGKGKGRDE